MPLSQLSVVHEPRMQPTLDGDSTIAVATDGSCYRNQRVTFTCTVASLL